MRPESAGSEIHSGIVFFRKLAKIVRSSLPNDLRAGQLFYGDVMGGRFHLAPHPSGFKEVCRLIAIQKSIGVSGIPKKLAVGQFDWLQAE